MKAGWHPELAGTGVSKTGSTDGMTVAVIIPTFNHARFLAEAIMSVQAQTRQADEIIVVDDGSTDDPGGVVAQFPTARLIRQDNRGRSGARNTGLRNCTTSHVVFLDADDRLLPSALDAGLTCIANHPDCAFVYGGYRLISEDGGPLSSDIVKTINGDAYLELLRQYRFAIMAVVYRRDCLLAMNGFDETLRLCEDYDLNLRITQKYPIAGHPAVVAEYRKHSQSLSNDFFQMLKTVLMVLGRHEAHVAADPLGRTALREGRAFYRNYYFSLTLSAASARWRASHDIGILARDLTQAARWSPSLTLRALFSGFGRRVNNLILRPIKRYTRRNASRP